MADTAAAGERRRYWFSLAALAVVLPTALVVHSDGTLFNKLRRSLHDPVIVERGETQSRAGANWRLTGLERLKGELPETVIVLAEFEAAVTDVQHLGNTPSCTVTLTDNQERRWLPLFLTERAVRQARPDAAEKPGCGAFGEAETGRTMLMAESFLVPEDAQGLSLFVTLGDAPSDRLIFR